MLEEERGKRTRGLGLGSRQRALPSAQQGDAVGSRDGVGRLRALTMVQKGDMVLGEQGWCREDEGTDHGTEW